MDEQHELEEARLSVGARTLIAIYVVRSIGTLLHVALRLPQQFP